MNSHYNFLVVGAGISAATFANLASQKYSSLLIDKRSHLAGNTYDFLYKNILVSKYGAHLFHTNSEKVWKFIQPFANWIPWQHKVLADLSGTLVPVPVNLFTLNAITKQNFSEPEEMLQWLKENTIPCENPTNSKELALSRVGSLLQKTLFEEQTKKQWNRDASELDPLVLARIPLRTSFDDRYFTDKYQALPEKGYTDFVQNMLNHPNITVRLNTDWNDFKNNHEGITWDHIIFTGPIDTQFESAGLPKLQQRSINFEWQEIPTSGFYQQNSVINQPLASTPQTRCVEYKHFLNQKSDWTIISKETTCDDGEPYYPIPTQENRDLQEKQKVLADKEHNVHFLGRLANYKQFNMDQAILNSMEYFEKHFAVPKGESTQ